MEDADHFAIHWDDPPAGPIVLAHERVDPPFFNIYLASALTGRTEEEVRHDTDIRAVITDVFEHYDYLGLFCRVYDPAKGVPQQGVEPGTAFEDLPDDFVCPACGVGKQDFSPME